MYDVKKRSHILQSSAISFEPVFQSFQSKNRIRSFGNCQRFIAFTLEFKQESESKI